MLFRSERVLQRCRTYKLRLNPRKYAFGVSSGQFLGFLVHQHGIQVDPAKIKAIRELSPPTSLRQLQSLMGRLNYIRRFIPDLSTKVLPMTKLLQKSSRFEWNDDCHAAFEKLKEDLLKSPTLLSPRPGSPLILYISHNEFALSAYLAQADELGRECPIYYLSRVMNNAEKNYSRV